MTIRKDSSVTGVTQNAPEQDPNSPTGSTSSDDKLIEHQFGHIVLTIQINERGEFVQVVKMSVDKDFRSLAQKLSKQEYHDVSSYYDDDEE